MNEPRVTLTQADLVRALRVQVGILNDLMLKVNERRFEYLPDIATKLRLLAVDKGRRNRPLLIDLMNEAGFEVRITVDSPFPTVSQGGTQPDSYSVQEYLQQEGFGWRDNQGKWNSVTVEWVICAFAETLGGAHQDWALPEKLIPILNFPIRIAQRRLFVDLLMKAAQAVGNAGQHFLEEYDRRAGANQPSESA